jgi:DNA-binding transcriptional MerR regulator/methylmalonyl-CoA mutase cobalamin-binding subunit
MLVSVAAIEQATGLDREVIRKWETRYGFPCPVRNVNGEREYPEDQVASLRLIRKLLDAGFRPVKVVGLGRLELEALADSLSPSPEGRDSSFENEALSILRRHDVEGLTSLFQRHISQQGVLSFVQDKLTPLSAAVGEAWFRGELEIFQEHLYTAVVQDVLGRAAAVMAPATAPPRVLLTTPPGELHVLGLTMSQLFFRLSGVYCVALGAQTPVAEICEAVEALDIAVVGLSISPALPIRPATAFLRELGTRLRPQTAIWVGGMGATRLPRRLPRVVPILSFGDAQRELDSLRGPAGRAA